MSEKISLEKIEKEDNSVKYIFTYTEGLSKYFSGEPFVIHYPESIESVPDAILAIPFAVNVLPIVWLTDSTLSLAEIDRDFYESISRFKKGYIDMYPETEWLGKLEIGTTIDCTPSDASGAVALFSGGLDATTTVLRHYEEKPELVVLWGADVKYDNAEGWQVMQNGLDKAACSYDLPLYVIRTSFRAFDKEGALNADFMSRLKDGWWHGVQHGIAIIGHTAPLMWLHKKKTLYIASSLAASNIGVRCASYPTIDDNVSFFGCNVVHDAFEWNRQDKVHYLVSRQEELKLPISLKVCWESQEGSNCCHCEKCFRTMVGLWAEGADPADYGFSYNADTIFDEIYDLIALKFPFNESNAYRYKFIQSGIKRNWDKIQKLEYGPKFKWMLNFDFDNAEDNPCRKAYRRKMKFKSGVASKMPWLRKLYRKLMRKD